MRLRGGRTIGWVLKGSKKHCIVVWLRIFKTLITVEQHGIRLTCGTVQHGEN